MTASHESRRRDTPIIFSGPMVRALLEGRKTQTRRVLKLPTKGEYVRPDMGGWKPTTNGGDGVFTLKRDGSRVPVLETVGIWNQTTGTCLDAPWQNGDRLWVREAHCIRISPEHATDGIGRVWFRADPDWGDEVRWRSPIHMPRWASRLTLTVTDVRVQRLQEISEEDAVAEGLQRAPGGWWSGAEGQASVTPQAAYGLLWNRLHGTKAWSANPWIVALTFLVEQRNIDTLQEAA